jgi:hypothetical protein
MFPTWSEILEVLRDLGYEKVGPPSQDSAAGTRQTPARLAAR